MNKILKLIILAMVLFTAYVAFIYLDSLEKLKPIEEVQKQISNCKKSENEIKCIYDIAIEKNDLKLCEKAGVLKDECIEDLESVTSASDCIEIVNFRQIDVCSKRFPEFFSKFDCNSIKWDDLKEYCDYLKSEN